MPWKTAVWTETVPFSTGSLHKLGPSVREPCYLLKHVTWSTAPAGTSLPNICVHWLRDDSLVSPLIDPRNVPPWGNQAAGPGTRSPANAPQGTEAPNCSWAPPGTRRIFFIYEGGGVGGSTFTCTATYWEAS